MSDFLRVSSVFLLVPCFGQGLYTRITVQFSSQKLPVQTLLALLLRNELSAEDFHVRFVLLSPSERMQLLEQLDQHTSNPAQCTDLRPNAGRSCF